VWADGNPLGSDDLPGVEGRRREHLAAFEGLQRDRLLADELFGEVRRLVDIAGATGTTADAYVDVARTRLLGVAGSLAASDAAVLASHDFLADLWWTDELLTSLARGRGLGTPRFLAELPVEGDDPEGMSILGYGGYGNMPPVANDDYCYTKHDTNLSVSPPGVMSNDYDPNGDPLTASLVSGPSHAWSFTFNSSGGFSYTPSYHYAGTDSFVYRVSDGQSTDDATVMLNVYNSGPIATTDSYQTKHDTALNVPAPGVKSNDYDGDGDPITAILVSGPSHASSFTFNSNGNGSFSYAPAYHYVGSDSFTYKVNDGIADSPTATVSINVYNNAPVANNDSYQTKHDVALNVSAPGVKSNDYDSDGDPMTAILVSGPSHASSFTFNYNGNGSFTYTPAYHSVGMDSFTYKVNDGVEDSLPATVSITVSNNPPMAVDDSGYIAASGVTRSVSGADGVLKNDYDPDGDTPLGATIATGASHGTVWFSNDGSFEYTSNPGYAGTDSFTYWAFDGIATSVSTATVTITVFRVDHQTVATSPADRTRTKVGVGEVVDLTVVPPSVPGVEWHLFGGGAISSNSGLSTTFTADERASESHVQGVVAGVSCTVHFNVVEPTGQTIEQAAGTGVWHVQGKPSVGFQGTPYIHPDDVSFQFIQVREGAVAGVGTGFFSIIDGLVHADGAMDGCRCIGSGTRIRSRHN